MWRYIGPSSSLAGPKRGAPWSFDSRASRSPWSWGHIGAMLGWCGFYVGCRLSYVGPSGFLLGANREGEPAAGYRAGLAPHEPSCRIYTSWICIPIYTYIISWIILYYIILYYIISYHILFYIILCIYIYICIHLFIYLFTVYTYLATRPYAAIPHLPICAPHSSTYAAWPRPTWPQTRELVETLICLHVQIHIQIQT